MAKEILGRIDGLLLTGSGPDIDPTLYGERQRFPFKKVDPKRSAFERELVKRALEKETPILGICGGMQTLNVAGGGSLYQDLPKQLPRALKHDQGGKPSHPVEIKRGTLLARIVGVLRLFVNSSHHQGVKEVAPGYIINAMAEDGVVEGIESVDFPFVVGVQWHPEYLHEGDQSREIFKAFLKRAAKFGHR
jgi:putative glutamine amidotransferase